MKYMFKWLAHIWNSCLWTQLGNLSGCTFVTSPGYHNRTRRQPDQSATSTDTGRSMLRQLDEAQSRSWSHHQLFRLFSSLRRLRAATYQRHSSQPCTMFSSPQWDSDDTGLTGSPVSSDKIDMSRIKPQKNTKCLAKSVAFTGMFDWIVTLHWHWW